MKKNSRLVYSTDQGRIREQENATASNNSGGDGIVRLSRETKGRKGSGVTLIRGIDKPDAELKAIAKSFKTTMWRRRLDQTRSD